MKELKIINTGWSTQEANAAEAKVNALLEAGWDIMRVYMTQYDIGMPNFQSLHFVLIHEKDSEEPPTNRNEPHPQDPLEGRG